MNLKDLRNKKICFLGLGLENLSLAKYLAKQGITVSVLDKRTNKELDDRYQILKKIKTDFCGGPDYLNKISNFDIIFKTPGFIGNLKIKKNAIITTPMELFFDLCPAKIIAITGTKGKGTAASLIFEILKTADKNVWLAGNIGNAPFDFIDKLKPDHFVILELSSFQLIDFKKRPYVAVVTNLFPEHLSPADPINPIYHKNLKEYYNAKANIFLYQNKNDWLVINKNSHHPQKLLEKVDSKKIYFDVHNFCGRKIYEHAPHLIGLHNKENIAAACAVAKILKIPKKTIQRAIQNFKGLEHHLEFIAEINGIRFYNDSASTMPQATLAAARAFTNPIILILGGVNKGYNLGNFAGELTTCKNLKTIILIGKTAPKLQKIFKKLNLFFEIIKADGGIVKIVNQTAKTARKGDVVLFSPGFASFDMFKNSKDRGEKFKKAVHSIEA